MPKIWGQASRVRIASAVNHFLAGIEWFAQTGTTGVQQGRLNMDQPVELADYIRALRSQLLAASEEGEQQDLRFAINSLDIEVQTTVERSAEVGGGIKVWVANLSGKGTATDKAIHTVRLSLTPLRSEDAEAKKGPFHLGASN